VTLATPLSGMVCYPWARTSYDQPTYQILSLYLHRYECMKGDKNVEIGLVCGYFGVSGSDWKFHMALFEIIIFSCRSNYMPVLHFF